MVVRSQYLWNRLVARSSVTKSLPHHNFLYVQIKTQSLGIQTYILNTWIIDASMMQAWYMQCMDQGRIRIRIWALALCMEWSRVLSFEKQQQGPWQFQGTLWKGREEPLFALFLSNCLLPWHWQRCPGPPARPLSEAATSPGSQKLRKYPRSVHS